MIYLASPYSHPDKEIERQRFEDVAHVTAKILAQGRNVFSPIVYGHTLSRYGMADTSAAAWLHWNRHMFNACTKFNVLALEGWDNSLGCTIELKWASDKNMLVEVLNPKDYGL